MPSTLTVNDRQLAISAEEGIKHLAAADWSASVRPTEEFQAVLALRVVLAGYLVGEVQRSVIDGVTVLAVTLDGRAAPPDRVAAAQLILAPLGVYADLAGLTFTTRPADTGVVPVPMLVVAGAVAVTMVIARAGVIMWVAQKATDIVDGALKRNDAAKQIQQADAASLQLVNAHVQREQLAGKALPLDDATTTALGQLKSRVESLIASGFGESVKSGFPSLLVMGGLAAAAVVTAVVIYKVARK